MPINTEDDTLRIIEKAILYALAQLAGARGSLAVSTPRI